MQRADMHCIVQTMPVPIERDALKQALRRLEDLDFVVCETVDRKNEPANFVFTSTVLQEVGYSTLGFSTRQLIHLRAAEWLEVR